MPLQGMDKVKKMIAKNKRDANENIKGVYLSGLQNIISETPADTGVHRNNWFLTVGHPSGLFGRDGNKSGGGSEASLAKMPDWVLNKKIYLTNNGPGITSLEYGGFPDPVKKGSYIKKTGKYEILSAGGFSKQAPGGWVRRLLKSMAKKVKTL